MENENPDIKTNDQTTSIDEVADNPEFKNAFAELERYSQADEDETPPALNPAQDAETTASRKRSSLQDEAFEEDDDELIDVDEDAAKKSQADQPSQDTQSGQQTQEAPPDENRLHRLIQAGRRAHLADEKIIDLVQNGAEVLEALAVQQDQLHAALSQWGPKDESEPSQPQQPQQTPPAPPVKKLEPLKLNLDEADLDEGFVKKVLLPLQNHLNALTETLSGRQENPPPPPQRQETQPDVTPPIDTATQRMIDGFFDKLTGEYPQFGRSAALTPQAGLSRRNVCMIAHGLGTAWNQAHPDGPMTTEQALQRGVELEMGESKAITALMTKLKKSQKRLTLRPTQRKTTTQHATNEDEATSHVNTYMREHGLTPTS